MGSHINQGTSYGELMNSLMKERPNFSTEEEFKEYAVAEVRRFISDLRSINIELSLRPPYKAHHAVSEKLSQS
ncbi:MAG TPA: hypothetical protein VJ302_14265 [Blastocatellia bacterium]|nr:hypothetical protein [Blastocatellia bacterium]